MTNRPPAPAADVEIDVRALLKSLWRASPYIIVLALIVGVATFFLLSRIEPVYKSETTVLIETGESDLTRATGAAADATSVLDQEAIASQVQLIRSRDLARRVSEKLNLDARPEYDPARNSGSFLNDLLVSLGLAKNPADSSIEERVLTRYYDNLQVFAVEKSRVIAIDFTSTDPKFAADTANTIASEYIALQREAKRDTTADATKWLESEIADLRDKVKEAEAKVEAFRSGNDLLNSGGATPTTLHEQQLAELSTELGRVHAARVEAEAKAAQIRTRIDSGAALNLTEVLNSQLIQRLIEQQVALRAQIAQFSATLLPEHPRMRELGAQVTGLDRQIEAEARKILDSLESEAKLAEAREAEIQRNLDALKAQTATANGAEVQLRALEREASAQRDLLDTYLRRYREALSRTSGDYLPADARIVSRASVAVDPDFPKKVPLTAAALAAFLLLAVAFVLIRELASGRPMRQVAFGEPVPAVPNAMPVGGHLRWADDRGIRRMMPAEPTLAPPTSEVERSLTAIATQIVADRKRCVIVTLAEGCDTAGRPLAAVALARALARAEQRVVLVDLRGDGADTVTMGEGTDLPGFSDLFAGEASFAQVIFRDRKSRAHFIPAGKQPLSAETVAGERLQTILSALDHTYDHLVIDARDEMIAAIGSAATAAMVVTEFGPADPRTIRAFDRVTSTSAASILLLVVDPAPASAEAMIPTLPGDEVPTAASAPPMPERVPAVAAETREETIRTADEAAA